MSTDLDLNEPTIKEDSKAKGDDKDSWFIILFLSLFVPWILQNLQKAIGSCISVTQDSVGRAFSRTKRGFRDPESELHPDESGQIFAWTESD